MNTFKLLGLDNVEERKKGKKNWSAFLQTNELEYNNYFKY